MFSIRASSLGELFDCPARWEARRIKNLHLPSSANAVLGKAVHASTAAFDEAALQGNPISIDEAVGIVADVIRQPEEEVDWGDDRPQEAENIGMALTELYCDEIAPELDYVAVEATCDGLKITDLDIVLTGTVDRVIETDQGFSIADIKTGKNAVTKGGTVKTQGHAAQMAVYELLAEHSTGLPITAPAQIVGLQVAKAARGRKVGIGVIAGGRDLLLGDEGSPGLLEHAAAILKRGLFPGNPRSMMCDKKYCPVHPRCKWRK